MAFGRALFVAAVAILPGLAVSNPISRDGDCGWNSAVQATCLGSTFGDCCSASGYCGPDSRYCNPSFCQSDFGSCDTGAQPISTDGSCGSGSTPLAGATCQGSPLGDCCSTSGYCGSTPAYCNISVCQTGFGSCSNAKPISTDGTCGANNGGATCTGSAFGFCCSSHGYCGNGFDYCDANCQSQFGECSG
jgi:hypothetical protein